MILWLKKPKTIILIKGKNFYIKEPSLFRIGLTLLEFTVKVEMEGTVLPNLGDVEAKGEMSS